MFAGYIALTLVCLVYVAEGYPTINLRHLFDANYEGSRHKKDDSPELPPKIDEEVRELDELRLLGLPIEEHGRASSIHLTSAESKPEEDLPVPAPKDIQTGQQEQPDILQPRAPTLSRQHGGENVQANPDTANTSKDGSTKQFHGAARLAFGQNPEVLPTQPTTTTKILLTTSAVIGNIPEEMLNPPSSETTHPQSPPVSSSNEHSDESAHSEEDVETPVQPEGNKEVDAVVAELESTKTAERRSVTLMPPKVAEKLLHHTGGGQYSAFDLAQYVFWTGDEAGVARTVEEFIQNGLMSRESAILFLRDIRRGIEYLQNSYANRVFPNEITRNHVKKNAPPAKKSTTTTTTSTTTPAPPPVVKYNRINNVDVEHLTGKNDEISLPLSYLLHLQEIKNARTKDYDENAGRAKVAEFLYNEYSLEQVIYQLAKVMFSQSLINGSDQAQKSMQKLTNFLENEVEISPLLQKKILDVILSALSDTLIEHPELLKSARTHLGQIYHPIALNAVDSMKH